ncbi:hypothetical protein [Haliscomenobacter sp.]|uniref:hypothetical protein n=1 Tax=Haliscomenobacter sp. TaxID=2717303 RepID=UPI003364EDEA
MINFCYDTMSDPELGYPNLADLGLGPDDFDNTWPRTIAFRLLVYLKHAGAVWTSSTVDQAPTGSWYPVALGWHDFDCDYFGLMKPNTISKLQQQEIKVLFYYHEGDNPDRIQERLDSLCVLHQLPQDCYLFVSANTAADSVDRCYYFPDHEYFLSYVNRRQGYTPVTDLPRPYDFTALNRIHKWWRGSIMSDLHADGILTNSLWSYNTDCTIDDREEDNPISIQSNQVWVEKLKLFLANGPYYCDGPDSDAHNDHRMINTDLYLNSYCHISIETLFDVDQSGGAFITEKTYKCMKFGQPFVIVGAVGSLAALRSAGYRTFDSVINNSYDSIVDNTQRWFAVKQTLQQIKQQDLHQWYLKCMPDLVHNQQLFIQRSRPSLDRLITRLNYTQ